MNSREYELFGIRQVREFDESWKMTNQYNYAYFKYSLLDLSDIELDVFIKKTIKSLKDKQKLITRLRNIPLKTIKNDLDPKTYKWIEDWEITNLYELQRHVFRRHDGTVSSRIVGIGNVKGNQILNVLAKHGVPVDSSLYTESWVEK